MELKDYQTDRNRATSTASMSIEAARRAAFLASNAISRIERATCWEEVQDAYNALCDASSEMMTASMMMSDATQWAKTAFWQQKLNFEYLNHVAASQK